MFWEICKLFWEIIPEDDNFDLLKSMEKVLLGFVSASTPFNRLGNIVILFTLSLIQVQRIEKY